ncbi:MAG: F0F1 ATP synthase subunit A [Elusimicrobia bacterium]|nr:F0F1 ATP synthase subunit A [Elusimicrobiota bacterium]
MDMKHMLEHHILDEVWLRLPFLNGLLPWSKHLCMMLLAASLLLIFLPLAARGNLGRTAKGLVEALVLFIRDEILEPNLGHAGRYYLGYFCTLFLFILTCNLLGLIPFGATATGNIAVTLALASTTFFLIHIAGIREQGFSHYLRSIVPAGVPVWLWPLLYPIELIGFITKAFALCIRLFANMIAGHIVILVLFGLIFVFGAVNPWVGLVVTAPASVVLVLFVMCLELFVAFLQAYIFTFLTAIFVGGAVHPH